MPSVYRQRVKPNNASLQMMREGVDHYRTSGVVGQADDVQTGLWILS